jgi:S-adenosylmethionine/arginine decarboxylase-like enzyme
MLLFKMHSQFLSLKSLGKKILVGKGFNSSHINNVLSIRNQLKNNITLLSKQNYSPVNTWGVLCSIDCHNCNPDIIRSAECLNLYVKELCKLIDMKTFGDCHIQHFGQEKKVEGYSLFQFIETSCISGHFANETNRAYIDCFSCKEYDTEKFANFTKNFFSANKYNLNVLKRE